MNRGKVFFAYGSLFTLITLTISLALSAHASATVSGPRTTKLFGELKSGILGPGGETTGYELDIQQIPLDTSQVSGLKKLAGHVVLVQGHFETKSSPIFGPQQWLRVVDIRPVGSVPKSPKDTVILTGTLTGPLLSPGGSGPTYKLSNIHVETDVSHTSNVKQYVGQNVIATGQFYYKRYVLKRTYIFLALEMKSSHSH